MALYLVSYELRGRGRSYDALWEDLRGAGGICVHDGVWLVDVRQNGDEVAAALRSHMLEDDRFLVVEIGRDTPIIAHNTISSVQDWLTARG